MCISILTGLGCVRISISQEDFFMDMKRIYDLIYSLAPDMGFTREELEDLLCNVDEIAEIDTEDFHELVYRLAEKGLLDEESLNNYLSAADSLSSKKT
jgi:hypothetical protein